MAKFDHRLRYLPSLRDRMVRKRSPKVNRMGVEYQQIHQIFFKLLEEIFIVGNLERE